MSETQHVAVLLDEVVDFLNAKQGGVFLDCTLGGAGHTRAILDVNPNNHVVGTDRDPHALQRAEKKLSTYTNRVNVKSASFSDLAGEVAGQSFNGILADLGLSSDQLAEQRGFSFKDKGALDMRMNPEQELTAEKVVNQYEYHELLKVFRDGGLTKDASRMAKSIINSRPIADTAQLVNCIHKTLGSKDYGAKVKDSATIVFQAIRIEVNQELEEIKALLDFVPDAMISGGRFVTISFHSLEDSLVTKCMRKWASGPEFSALWKTNVAEKKVLGKLLTKKAITASAEEISKNPRARSARLRAFEFFNVCIVFNFFGYISFMF